MLGYGLLGTQGVVESKQLGNTDVVVPEIGLGTYAFTGTAETIRMAVELGAALVDTAELYGTEDIVGRGVKEVRRRCFIATKTNHWRYHDVLRAADESLRRLGVDVIDLYQVHWPNAAVPVAETMAAMERLVDLGKVRFIGVSNFSVQDLKEAQAAMSKYRIVSDQVRYNLVDRDVESAILPYCQKFQITVIAYSPLAKGLRSIFCADPCLVLDRLARRAGRTSGQVALNWCVSKPGVIAIPKANSAEHVVENCEASGWALTCDELKELDAKIKHRRRSRLVASIRRRVRRAVQMTRSA